MVSKDAFVYIKARTGNKLFDGLPQSLKDWKDRYFRISHSTLFSSFVRFRYKPHAFSLPKLSSTEEPDAARLSKLLEDHPPFNTNFYLAKAYGDLAPPNMRVSDYNKILQAKKKTIASKKPSARQATPPSLKLDPVIKDKHPFQMIFVREKENPQIIDDSEVDRPLPSKKQKGNVVALEEVEKALAWHCLDPRTFLKDKYGYAPTVQTLPLAEEIARLITLPQDLAKWRAIHPYDLHQHQILRM
ncbi:conserved hypothetical protein [Ricinus communis]|uniref:Uncharacterized protein n=1 Tax=Ricinus communis TaxID=3988 RepID=B9RXZ1_RICCO|nr:conserved hypothetical protein [Ricinus communis]